MPRRQTPDPTAAKVGARIRALREERGLSLSKLGAMSGVSKGSLSGIERGLVLITIATLSNIAHALGLRPVDVLAIPEDGPLEAFLDLIRRMPEEERLRALAALQEPEPPPSEPPPEDPTD
ncbi:helix-turn-helix domain-containing protein [Polyangium aurulentum]|uniref:helix-turn-helix domain-containing protein n=1 Tax=Polyangium aurulentum TaxID=2567896 RepID=UPI0010AECFF2|nr:helix-turn-helix transcriptional regulator [Polyangium aurulentum]UQA58475.1 helix-turn-helix domain-containing protein [Polyangium aurulentum]